MELLGNDYEQLRPKGELLKKAEPQMSQCCTCGYSWRTGHDGSHSCATQLKSAISGALAVITLRESQDVSDAETIKTVKKMLLTTFAD